MPAKPLPSPTRIKVTASARHRAVLESGGVLERCSGYVKALARELALPLRVQLELDAAGALPEGAVFRLWIGGECVTLWAVPEGDADALTQALSDCLLRCRSLLIDSDAARQLWIRWFPARAGDFDDVTLAARFRELCAELVTRGLKPDRARECVASWNPGAIDGETVRRAVEDTLSRSGDVGVGLRLSAEQHARCFGNDGQAPAASEGRQTFPEMLDMMSDGLFYELGLSYRIIGAQVDPALHAPWFQVRWNDVSAPAVKGLAEGEVLVNDTVDRLNLLNIKGREAVNPANQIECAIVGDADAKTCEEAGLTIWDADAYVILHMSAEVRRNAGSFVTEHLTTLYQLNLSDAFPELVREAEKRFDRGRLTRILRLLLDEEMSVRDLRSILNALLAVNAVTTADLSRFIVFGSSTGFHCPVGEGRSLEDLGLTDYCDCVRAKMRRQLGHKYTRGGNTLVVYLVASDIENRLRAGTVLSAQERVALLEGIGDEIGLLPAMAQAPVILTTWDTRRRLRALVAYDFPRLAVLSYQELAPDLNIQPIARIDLQRARPKAIGGAKKPVPGGAREGEPGGD